MRIKMHLLGTGTAVLLSVYAVTAYAGQGIREQKSKGEDLTMPEIRYEEPEGGRDYYKSVPEIRIVHRQTGAVTKYEFLSADHAKKTGSLELMDGQDEESVYLPEDIFEDGENVLHVWMEKYPNEPNEGEIGEDGTEGTETGGEGSEGTRTEGDGTETTEAAEEIY
ncbi:hypothetical protein [Schaedlerella sp.]|uniref:hypothetical protein n=1 Tax=Schaedlerella sp. TaxID=2676057 RepID=UPI003747139D